MSPSVVLVGTAIVQFPASAHAVLTAPVHVLAQLLTVRTNVAALSQPLLLFKCAVCVPPPVKVSAFHTYGNAFEQMVRLVDDDVAEYTVSVAAVVVAELQLLVNTARYWFPF